MDHAQNTPRFDRLELALEAAAAAVPLLDSLPRKYRDLADQGRRSVTSIALNLAEGSGRFEKDRAYHYRVAYGALRESQAVFQMLKAVGLLSSEQSERLLEKLDRVGAMTWRLIHPRRP